ncbi:MAG TPA: alginate lyase family protein [Candidatus Acidoferrales bacterium]|nr:alginate lyase family protein [Candidatus Acidoferrales bacterium]
MSDRISRRSFCVLTGAFAAGLCIYNRAFGAESYANAPDVAAIDRRRILTAADRYLKEQPITVTASSSPRTAGGKHDYFSEGDYWWPNPKDPNGPYIQRDGMSNPDNFNAHRLALIRLSVQVPALAAAWQLTKKNEYATQAAKHLRAWFLDAVTLMNPNLQYAQAIHGITTGRGTGIIDTLHLVEVARSIPFVERAQVFSSNESAGLKKWFADYIQWMTTSKNGQAERDAKNNHTTAWVAQAAEFAAYTGNAAVTEFCRKRLKEVIVPDQIAPDGSFPQELRRTKPYGYCIFNLDVMATVCQILSMPSDNLFAFTSPDGRSFAQAMAFMFPFIADKNKWPYKHDVEYWNDWPVRQPSLLFAGIALDRPEYFPVWRRLNPDPTVPEIIRNFPIRQPLLWVS